MLPTISILSVLSESPLIQRGHQVVTEPLRQGLRARNRRDEVTQKVLFRGTSDIKPDWRDQPDTRLTRFDSPQLHQGMRAVP